MKSTSVGSLDRADWTEKGGGAADFEMLFIISLGRKSVDEVKLGCQTVGE